MAELRPRLGPRSALRRGAGLLSIALVAGTGCATRFDAPSNDRGPRFRIQSAAIAPGNGGGLVDATALEPGDILLSSGATLQSAGIQLVTLTPVSHASIHLGAGLVAEAVGDGVRLRPLDAVRADESTIVAFRDPLLTVEQAATIRDWATARVGTRYNTIGVVLSAPFVVSRRVCEVPLVPGPLRDACIRGFAIVELGASRDDRFFCSQFVLEAYRQAGAPLAAADPRWVSPADLLHMREGDVPTIAALRPLRYVGHVKYTPPPPRREDAP